MSTKLKKVKLKGNESFNFREGWLRKGMRCVEECETLFTEEDVMERLGVGSKMVKSIRFWLDATSVCEEKRINKGRGRAQYLTDSFGRVIADYDPYFDDIFTLFLIHYHIVSNDSMCMVWNIFFNEYEGQDFTKDNMIEVCADYLDKKMEPGATYSHKSFEDDCASVLKMYVGSDQSIGMFLDTSKDETEVHPEDSLACPLVELGLLQRSSKQRDAYIKAMPARGILDKLAVLYVITQNLPEDKVSVSIDDLLNAPNNIGRVFNLSRVAINEYLDQLRIAGYLTINRTAGLDMVYIESKMQPQDIMIEYYKKAQVQ